MICVDIKKRLYAFAFNTSATATDASKASRALVPLNNSFEKYKTVMPLVNLFQHLFYSQYFRIEMAATISQRIRQIDRSKNTIEHRTNHRGSRYRKSGMSQPYSRCYCLQSRGFTRHIRPGKDTDIPILQSPNRSLQHLSLADDRNCTA